MSEIWNLSALCRCCLADGNFKRLELPHINGNDIEVYANLLQETLNISINPPPLEASYSICDVCIARLRDAHKFKKQVLECEEKFQSYCQNELALSNATVKIENDTEEVYSDGDGDHFFTHNNDDDEIDYNNDSQETLREGSLLIDKSKFIKCNIDGCQSNIDGCQKIFSASGMISHKIHIHGVKLKPVKPRRPPGRPKKIKTGRPTKAMIAAREAEKMKKDVIPHPHIESVKIELPPEETREPKEEEASEEKLKCDIEGCMKTFITVGGLRTHREEYHDVKEKPSEDRGSNVLYCIYKDDRKDKKNETTTKKDEKKKTRKDDTKAKSFTCDIEGCTSTFSKEARLAAHKTHKHTHTPKDDTKAKSFTCDIEGCKRTFSKKSSLATHKTLKHSIRTRTVKRIQCRVEGCGENFRRLVDLLEHKEQKHGIPNIKVGDAMAELQRSTSPISVLIKDESGEFIGCKACGQAFKTNDELNTHLVDEHKGLHKCPICKNFYKTQFHLHQHYKKIHLKIRPLHPSVKCKYCPKTYNSTANLKAHENSHTREQVFKCDLCNKEFLYKNTLKKHIDRHEGKLPRFMCDQCGLCANDKTNLRVHIRTVHDKVKNFSCHLCDRKFGFLKNLKGHLLNHAGVKSKIYKFTQRTCPVCAETFFDRYKYRAHLGKHRVEAGLGKECKECGKQFSTIYSLQRHSICHSRNSEKCSKDHACPVCQKRFGQKGMVYRHLRNVHQKTNREKVKCTLCKMMVADLTKHMKGHMERPYACTMCDKKYPARNALNRHITNNHTGKEKSQCPYCPKSYIDVSKLNTHLKKKHPNDTKEEVDNYDAALTAYSIQTITPYTVDVETSQ